MTISYSVSENKLRQMGGTPTKVKAQLPILLSARIRLNEEQRSILKAAFTKHRAASIPAPTVTFGGSTVSSSTSYTAPQIDKGLPDIVMSDLLGSRECIPLTTVLQICQLLQVNVISREDVLKACDGYTEYIWSQYNLPNGSDNGTATKEKEEKNGTRTASTDKTARSSKAKKS